MFEMRDKAIQYMQINNLTLTMADKVTYAL